MILEIVPSGPVETNAYLIGCGETKKAAIIDAPLDSSKKLIKLAKEHGLALEMLLLTHSHWDHIAEAALLKEKLGIPVYIHREDAANLEHPGSDGLPLYFSFKGCTPDGYLTEGQEIEMGKLHIAVIDTPGHTPGGVCFYLAKQKTLFSGDTLFRGTMGNLSFATARPHLMWSSLKKLAHLPKDTIVYPGHGDATTIGDEAWIVNAEKMFS